jgi:hypothetical protein
VKGLAEFAAAGKHFMDFTLAQQAHVVADYFNATEFGSDEEHLRLLSGFVEPLIKNCGD